LIKKTALNPAITVPLCLASLYTVKGRAISAQRPIAAQWLRTLAAWSLLRGVSRFLDKGVTNNWTNDVYDWKKEIVIVTGGSDGIGALVVQSLAQKGIRVIVIDIQKPKFVGKTYGCLDQNGIVEVDMLTKNHRMSSTITVT
jgi:all-trans-retinol dehydrogenase (NAD+)